jgi:hypothetical protein
LFVSSHTRDALARVRELATEPVPQRLARTLLRLAGQVGRREADGSIVVERITQQELAEIAGTSLYTVSRTLAGSGGGGNRRGGATALPHPRSATPRQGRRGGLGRHLPHLLLPNVAA